MEVAVTDSGPGIANLEEILDGRYKSDTGMGMGIIGTRRLMDEFTIESRLPGHHAAHGETPSRGTASEHRRRRG